MILRKGKDSLTIRGGIDRIVRTILIGKDKVPYGICHVNPENIFSLRSNEPNKMGTPELYAVHGKNRNKIIFYPAADKQYVIKISYYPPINMVTV